MFWSIPFLFLWWVLVSQLHAEWTVNPQYSYGWVVPFLCLGLLIRRWHALRPPPSDLRPPTSGFSFQHFSFQHFAIALFALLAFFWLPTRLIQEANPEWRLISWALGVEVVGLTLCAIYLGKGRGWLGQLAFPVCFFLVAVPWPTLIEAPVIQSLTRINSAIVIELLGWLGIPAIQHGNLIEVGTGTVGIDEACSGIRSLQSTLMISLFFGEFYRMSFMRRLLLVPAGFILAMAFNVCRMSLLTWIAAKNGVAAISDYHDPAGVTITVICTAGLWVLAMLFNKKQKEVRGQRAEVGGQRAEVSSQESEVSDQRSAISGQTSDLWPLPPGLFRLSLVLLAWLVLVEVGVESWYRLHERRMPKSISWVIKWPRNNPTFAELPVSEKTKRLLRYDEASIAAWQEADGTRWEMTFLRWLPGRIAVYLATFHTPEVCFSAAGHSVQSISGLDYLPVHGLKLPFRSYLVEDSGDTVYVFYCLWEDRAQDQSFETTLLTYGNRLGPVLAGRRNVGERSLEIVVRGIDNAEAARTAVIRQLEKLIKIEKPEANLGKPNAGGSAPLIASQVQ